MPEIVKKDYNRKIYNRFQILKGVEPSLVHEVQEGIVVKKVSGGFRCDSCMHKLGVECKVHQSFEFIKCSKYEKRSNIK